MANTRTDLNRMAGIFIKLIQELSAERQVAYQEDLAFLLQLQPSPPKASTRWSDPQAREAQSAKLKAKWAEKRAQSYHRLDFRTSGYSVIINDFDGLAGLLNIKANTLYQRLYKNKGRFFFRKGVETVEITSLARYQPGQPPKDVAELLGKLPAGSKLAGLVTGKEPKAKADKKSWREAHKARMRMLDGASEE